MKAEWSLNARKIPDEVMKYLGRIAVRAIEEKNYSPEVIADVLDISRSSVYDLWVVIIRPRCGADIASGSYAPLVAVMKSTDARQCDNFGRGRRSLRDRSLVRCVLG
jgi:hypothetical protein